MVPTFQVSAFPLFTILVFKFYYNKMYILYYKGSYIFLRKQVGEYIFFLISQIKTVLTSVKKKKHQKIFLELHF